MRILEDAGIPSDKYELYFMSGDNDKHPYQTSLQITSTVFLIPARTSMFDVILSESN